MDWSVAVGTPARCNMFMGVGAVLALAATAMGQSYRAVPVGTLGGSWSRANGVNDAGVLVGGAADAQEETRPFVYENGVVRDLGVLAGGVRGEAMAINNNGVVVGYCDDGRGVDRAVVWTKNAQGLWEVADLGTLGGNFARAADISDNGWITGDSQIAPPPGGGTATGHAFVMPAGGGMADLGTLVFQDPTSIVFSAGTAVNSTGEVVGFSYPVLSAELDHAFLFTNGVMQDLTPRGRRPMMRAEDITDQGLIVGSLMDQSPTRAFRMTTSDTTVVLIPLLSPTHTDNAALAANEQGLIVGYSAGGDFGSFDQRAFLADGAVISDLNTLAGNPTLILGEATSISGNGHIAANSLTPLGTIATLLAPTVRCVADVDDGSGTGTPDGGVTVEDLLFYLSLYDSGDIRADVDNGTSTGTPDGGVTIEDLLYYLQRYDSGC